MTRTTLVRFGLLAVCGAIVGTTLATVRAQDAPKTISEKIKEKAGSAVSSLKKGAISAEEAIKEKFTQAKNGVVKMEIEARVYARIHWDKALTEAKIDLATPEKGAIVLNGTVPDEKAKTKAAELAADTVGVTKVTNLLTVLTTSTGATVSPTRP